MANTAVLIELDGGQVKEANFGAITAARQATDGAVSAFVLGDDAAACKPALEAYGVDRVVELKAAGGDMGTSPEPQVGAIADALKTFEIKTLLGVSSPWGNDILARVAAILDAPLVLDCLGINPGEGTVTKSHFAGKTIATLKLNGDHHICGIRPNTIEAKADPREAEFIVHEAPASGGGSRLTIKEIKGAASGAVELTEASIIITGGRPIGSADNYTILQDAAAQMGAAVGASRAAVDAGYAPHTMQIGQTGKTVSPKLYIGCGLSGSVQHYAGMKTSRVIVGINTDKDAPIFRKCDYGIVGDLFEVVPVLTDALKES